MTNSVGVAVRIRGCMRLVHLVHFGPLVLAPLAHCSSCHIVAHCLRGGGGPQRDDEVRSGTRAPRAPHSELHAPTTPVANTQPESPLTEEGGRPKRAPPGCSPQQAGTRGLVPTSFGLLDRKKPGGQGKYGQPNQSRTTKARIPLLGEECFSAAFLRQHGTLPPQPPLLGGVGQGAKRLGLG